MKLCIHCRFAVRELEWKCHHPDATSRELDLVTGEDRIDHSYCQLERQIGKCGPGAGNWEPIVISSGGGFV
jgi:hypothetical protein